MLRRALIGELCAGAAVLGALSCARLGYELLPEESLDPLPDGTNVPRGGLGGGGPVDAGAGGGALSGAGGAASASGSGGAGSSTDAGDSGGSGGSDAGVSNGGTGGAALVGCEPAPPAASWAFVSDAEGWQLDLDPGATGTMSWTSAAGDPAPGSLQVDATVVNGMDNVRVYLDQSPSDFTGRVIYARVFLASGSGVSAKVFVMTGASGWGDGYEVSLVPGGWQCVSLDLEDPDVVTPGFDRTAVRMLGVFFFGDASARLYVDQISY